MKINNLIKKFFIVTLIVMILITSSSVAFAENNINQVLPSLDKEFECKSAILMEATTGTVLYEQNPDEALPPASVTKVMTLLLVMEAIQAGKINLTDAVTASAYACSMGGSQIYLKEGEQMTVEDMIKSVVIASANDAAVALAEHIAGSETAFVNQMNERAKALGMNNTNFENTNGLDDTANNHVTSARDIAIMSKELIKYEKITEYSSIWMDTVRNGEFGLTNTNRLIRFYKGATGLKTGSTSKAGFCISATATRDGMTLICVIMSAPSRDLRNQIATNLLDWGFSTFSLYKGKGGNIDNIYVLGGKNSRIDAYYNDFFCIVEKGKINNVDKIIEVNNGLSAPIDKNKAIGKIIYKINGIEIGETEIFSEKAVEKTNLWCVFIDILSKIIFCS